MPRKTHHQGALEYDEFDALVAAHPKMQAPVIAACRAVLIDGMTITAAANELGYTKQRLKTALDTLNPGRKPEGWVRRWVVLPASQMRQVMQMERAARRELQADAEADTAVVCADPRNHHAIIDDEPIDDDDSSVPAATVEVRSPVGEHDV